MSGGESEGYEGREQSLLKHRVLKEYAVSWAMKLGSRSRFERTRIWYVDTFAGPWQSKEKGLGDTSIEIGLRVLEVAKKQWRSRKGVLDASAIFVEKRRRSFERLQRHLRDRPGDVRAEALHGTFAQHVGEIASRLGSDPALIFVDPTGWKGAEMRNLVPLLEQPRRDVIVNVMYDFIHRFQDDPREYLRQGLKALFGLGTDDIPPGLDEQGLMALYRSQLKEKAELRFAVDLAVPHPRFERTWYRLVLGSRHQAAIQLFRDVEAKVIGREAPGVRAGARRRHREEATRQLELGIDEGSARPGLYFRQHERDQRSARSDVLNRLSTERRLRFEALWPGILEARHITYGELNGILAEMARDEVILVRRAGRHVDPPTGKILKADILELPATQ